MRSTSSGRISWRIVPVAILALGCGYASALDPDKSLSQYVHEVWQIQDGLPQNSVNDIEQDVRSYLWLATLEGLVQFDGVTFTVFNKGNTDAILSNEMRSIHRDDQGVLWIGSYGGGLIRYGEGTFTSFGPEEGLEETRVWQVSGSRAGGVWLATHDGLYRFRDGTFTRFTTDDGLAGNDVRCVHVDVDGKVWAGTMNGLSLYERGSFRNYTTEDGLAHDKVKSVFRDRAGRLWIGTHSGLNVLEDGFFSEYSAADGLAHASVTRIFEDRAGAMWFGTEGGVTRLIGGEFSSFTPEHGLSQNIVAAFFEDQEGSLWIGTEAGGLNRFRDGKFVSFSRQGGFPVDLTWSCFEARDGRLFIGSRDGLVIFDGRTFTLHRPNAGGSNNGVSAIYQTRDGTIWVGTRGDGLYTFANGSFNDFPGRVELSSDYVHSLQEDASGDLWIGTRDGLRRLRDGVVTRYSTRDGLPGSVIRSLLARRDGGLWIATGTGLSLYRDGTFTNFTTADGLSSNAAFAFHRDDDGTLWIGTYGGGLNRYRDGEFHHVGTKDGLFDDVVYVILEDGHRNLWLTGNKGVFRIAKSEFDDFVHGRIESVSSVSYGVADGMKSRECNGGLQSAGCRTRDGKMWFPTIRGVVSVDPDHLVTNPVVPPVYVEKMVFDGEEIVPDPGVQLRPGTKNLEFHYAALSYAVPKKVFFKYMLEGYETEWVDAGTRRAAYYTNLPPGEYTFRVKACNDDGVWNEAGASLIFEKRPHFHETAWFTLIAAAVAVMALYAAYRVRIRRMEKRERELEALVDQRTEELKDASLRDSLTGLRNRRFVTEVVKPETVVFAERKDYLVNHDGPRPSNPLDGYMGIFLLDIDHFKAVNDSLGHEAGDRVLAQFAELVSGAMRKDDILVRWGGEEFLIVLRNTAYEFIERFAHKVKDLVERAEFTVSDETGATVRKTCSIGYVPFPFYPGAPEKISFEQAIMLADLGLYHSKRNGRNLAVGVVPGTNVPREEELARMLSSLEFGSSRGFLGIEVDRAGERPRIMVASGP
jgi:diguanylate cyclase (GGDEF)-like protein